MAASSMKDIIGLRTEIQRHAENPVATYGRSHYEELAAMEAFDRLCDSEQDASAIEASNRLHDAGQERWPDERNPGASTTGA